MNRCASNSRGRCRGFTLIEVLAAMLLIVLVLPVVMKGMSMATSAAAMAKHRTEAIGLAQSKLHELLGTGDWQSGSFSGDFSPDWPQYQWSVQLQNWQPPSGNMTNDVQELDVTVTWNGAGGQPGVSLSTLVYANANPLTASTTVSSGSPTGTGSTGTSTGGGK